MLDTPEPSPNDIDSQMTTLDGYVTALSIVRWSDGLVTMPTDAESWYAWGREFHALTTIIDATVKQARKLSRVIHGEEPLHAHEGRHGLGDAAKFYEPKPGNGEVGPCQ